MSGLEAWFLGVTVAVIAATIIHAGGLYRMISNNLVVVMKSEKVCVCSSCFEKMPYEEAIFDGEILTSDCCGEAMYEMPELMERFYRKELDSILAGRTVYDLSWVDRQRLRYIEDALAEYILPGQRPTPETRIENEQIRLSGQRDAVPK